jgi:hypothetical protein
MRFAYLKIACTRLAWQIKYCLAVDGWWQTLVANDGRSAIDRRIGFLTACRPSNPFAAGVKLKVGHFRR